MIAYPNPVRDHVQLKFEHAEGGHLHVVVKNLYGKPLICRYYSLAVGAETLEMDVSQLSGGLYIVMSTLNGKQIFSRLVVE